MFLEIRDGTKIAHVRVSKKKKRGAAHRLGYIDICWVLSSIRRGRECTHAAHLTVSKPKRKEESVGICASLEIRVHERTLQPTKITAKISLKSSQSTKQTHKQSFAYRKPRHRVQTWPSFPTSHDMHVLVAPSEPWH